MAEAERAETYDDTTGVEADNSDSDDYDPSSNMPFSVPDPGAPQDNTSFPSVAVPDPHSATSSPLDQEPSRTASRASAPISSAIASPKKPRMKGGFLVEDDEDDDKGDASSYEPTSVTDAMAPSEEHQLYVSQISSDSVPTSAVSIQKDGANVVVPDSVPTSLPSAPPNSGSVTPSQSLSNTQVRASPNITSGYTSTLASALPKARLPNDRVGMLEDRIKEDPRGDMDAWLNLIKEHQSRNKFDEARRVYDRFLQVFPSAAEQWVAYANMEIRNDELYRLEQIFGKALLKVPNVELWSIYLDYIKRRNVLTASDSDKPRQIITQAYEFALQNIGMDKDSANIWQDYIQIVRSMPGNHTGTGWQDTQKMDLLRNAYQKAICVPTQAVNALWKEYDTFEMSINRITGRKFLQEKSPAYMTARSSFTALQNLTKDLDRTTLPKLPPHHGFEGDAEYQTQVEIWRQWIQWEKDDPLVLKDEDFAAYKGRILYVYRQSLMALRYWPQMWFDAAEFCFQHGLETEGNEFLKDGIEANPESCLLAFKRADRIESTTSNDEGQDPGAKIRGSRVREPYDKVLDALYELINKARKREAQEIARVELAFAEVGSQSLNGQRADEEDEDEENGEEAQSRSSARDSQLESIKRMTNAQVTLLSRTISFAWVALMRAMRRIQGKGKIGEMAGGSRQVFADARKRGKILSDVYIASALIEYHCYKDPAATKIFERGMKLFPEDENFALEYLKHLIAINDVTNARAIFETTVGKLTSSPETVARAKPIFSFLHEYESQYGELAQIARLEKRMAELFPEDPTLKLFSHRYASSNFDPTKVRPTISPNQLKSIPPQPTIQEPTQAESPLPPRPVEVSTNSPKRPLPTEDVEEELNPPRKLARGESPLKGAAGRRLDQQKRSQNINGGSTSQVQYMSQPPPPPLAREILFLLSIIPKASTYDATRLNPVEMVKLIRQVQLPPNADMRPSQYPPTTGMPPVAPPYMVQPQYPGYSYGP